MSTSDGATALTLLKSSLAIDPNHVPSLTLMAQLAHSTGALDPATSLMRRAAELDSGNAKTLYTLGALLLSQDILEEAEDYLLQALKADPDLAEVMIALGNLNRTKGRWSSAADYYEQALQVRPDLSEVETNLGAVRLAQGRQDEALVHHRKAVALKPDFDLAHHNLLLSLHYSDADDPNEIFRTHQEWGRRVEDAVEPAEHDLSGEDKERPLRVGFLSPDLNYHPVSQFLLPYLKGRRSSDLTVMLYSASAKKDQVTKSLIDHSDDFKQVHWFSDPELASLIRQDRIDILVDLSGHTSNTRVNVFARRPAPVQVTWIGYPDTTGLTRMDYRLTDAIADPAGVSDELATETLVRLPCGFLCYNPPDDAPKVAGKNHDGRPVTFGSMNNLSKVTDQAVACWSEILLRVPDSRLLLKARSLNDEATCRHLAERFASSGVSKDRLDIRRHVVGMAAHYDTYNEIDIALDTFPYNGTTTTCDALWMGVPMVCLSGDRHSARVSASILNRLGMQDWIADTVDAYVEKAVQAALNRDDLSAVQTGLRDRMLASTLVDEDRFAEGLDAAFRSMWRQACSQ